MFYESRIGRRGLAGTGASKLTGPADEQFERYGK
jgi:hypothetical protein